MIQFFGARAEERLGDFAAVTRFFVALGATTVFFGDAARAVDAMLRLDDFFAEFEAVLVVLRAAVEIGSILFSLVVFC